MNVSFKARLIAGFLLAFLAGAAAGGFIAARSAHQHAGEWSGHKHSLAERMRQRMQTHLDLTPEQLTKAQPIFENSASQLEKIREDTGQRVRQVMAEANRALAPELTDAQRAKLSLLEKNPRGGRGERPPGRRKLERPPPPTPAAP